MTRFSFSSLRARLLFLVLLAIIPALGVILYTAVEMRRSASVEAQTNALRLAQSVASSQDDLIEGAHQLLTALTQMPAVRSGNSAECNAMFADLLKQDPRYNNFVATKPNGDVFCSAVPFTRQINLADRLHFQTAVRTGGFAVADYLVARTTGKTILSFAYPVLDASGQIKAVLFAGLDLEWLNAVIAKTELPAGTTLTVIDRKGTVLARVPNPEKWVGKSLPDAPLIQTILSRAKGTIEASGVDGIPRLYGFSPLGETGGAYVSIGIPKDVAFATANRILIRNLIALGVVALFALMAAWFGSDWFILRQVNALTRATKRLNEGDLSARTEVPYGKGELSALARTFDQMASSMEQLIAERKRSEQRLTSLHEINVATTSSLDLHAVLNVLMEKIDLFLPYAAMLVWLWNKKNGLWDRAACWNLNEGEWKGRELKETPPLVKAAIEGRAPVVASNVQTDPRTLDTDFYRRHGLVSYLGVPLLVQGEVLGVLVFLTRAEHEFASEEIEFLSTLAGQAAMAIYNARLYEQTNASTIELGSTNQRLERLLGELSGLYTALTPLAPTQSINEMLDGIIERLMKATGAEMALIRLQGKAKEGFVAAQRGFPDYYLKAVETVKPGSAADLVFNSGEPIIAPDIAAESRLKGKAQLQVGLRSCVMLPLKVQGEVRGLIHLASRELGYFKEEQEDHLMAIAHQMGIALENRDFLNELKASRDALQKANRDLKRQEEIQELLKELSQDITSLNIDSLLRKMTGKVREVLKVDVSDVRVVEKGVWQVIGASGIESNLLNPPGSATTRGLSSWTLEYRQPLMIEDITKTNLPTGTTLRSLNLHGYLAVPLFSRAGEVIGVLRALTHQPRNFTQEEVDLLQQLANGAGIALENARLLERIKGQAVELEKAAKVKDEFLGFVSHELRTPLNAVIAYTIMMQDKLLGEVHPEQEKALEKMLTYSKDLLTMINSLLEVTRIEAGRVEVESHKLDLSRFIEDLKSVYDVPTGKAVALQWDYPSDLPTVKTDSGKLRHILQNLINNAIKFTEKGNVKISVRVIGEATGERQQATEIGTHASSLLPHASGKRVEFKVTDTGIGIAKDSLPVIFEMFRQVDGTQGKPSGGIGLGLHIVKKFTEMLGGRVDVESEPGEGSTFTITIPFDAGHQKRSPAELI